MTTLNDLNGYLDDEAYTVRVGELRALLSASIADTAGAKADGWKLVPIEPTEAMVRAACLKQSNAAFESYEAWHDSHSSGISARIRQLVTRDYRVMIDAAPPAPSVADAAGAKDADRFLTEGDMAALFMFVSQCEDSEADGYTARKETMKRLAELGCVESKGFGRYAPTMFGLWLIDTSFEQNPSLPLLTRDDYNAKSAKESGK